jgi:two-component system response regulator YesN
MYNLLIVDDEPLIVDVLCAMIQQADVPELNINAAYSAKEAIDLLHRINAHIVLSDIRMPEISGLELHSYAKEIWPRCKFIFLTGYDDFEYAQQSVRSGVVDCVLKNEGGDRVILAVKKAIEQIERSRSDEQLLEVARQQYAAAIPKLREDYLSDLMQDSDGKPTVRRERFKELGIELDADQPVFLLAGNVAEWPSRYRFSDRSLLHYAIQNVTEEYMQGFARSVSIVYERKWILWFIQSVGESENDIRENLQVSGNRTATLVTAALDSIQSVCVKLFDLQLSLGFDRSPADWGLLSRSFETVRSGLNRAFGSGREIVIVDSVERREETRGTLFYLTTGRLLELETMLESGQQRLFVEFVTKLAAIWESLPVKDDAFVLQQYYAVLSLILGYADRRQLIEAVTKETAINKLYNNGIHMNPPERLEQLRWLADVLFREQQRLRDTETSVIIRKAHEYIDDNLSGDVSLSAVANFVYVSPSYLSRLYKQETGTNFSDFINRKKLSLAKIALSKPHLKIQDIAQSLGFDSATYFAYFFKRHNGVTPQEYRSMQME